MLIKFIPTLLYCRLERWAFLIEGGTKVSHDSVVRV
jgi:hypothetical protein